MRGGLVSRGRMVSEGGVGWWVRGELYIVSRGRMVSEGWTIYSEQGQAGE